MCEQSLISSGLPHSCLQTQCGSKWPLRPCLWPWSFMWPWSCLQVIILSWQDLCSWLLPSCKPINLGFFSLGPGWLPPSWSFTQTRELVAVQGLDLQELCVSRRNSGRQKAAVHPKENTGCLGHGLQLGAKGWRGAGYTRNLCWPGSPVECQYSLYHWHKKSAPVVTETTATGRGGRVQLWLFSLFPRRWGEVLPPAV